MKILIATFTCPPALDGVAMDSSTLAGILSPGGVLAWHHCGANHRDVVKYVRECGHAAKLVGGTTVAFAIKPN